MGTYVLRRLLLMIPTLIGITFLVFMLLALAPGGIGAAMKFSSGGQMSATAAALQQAYLEDRYGLNDPAVVQYARWLERISPIKFGTRDQVDGEDLVRPPKPVKEPPLWRWFADELPAPPMVRSPIDPAADQSTQQRTYRVTAGEYAQARAQYIASTTRMKEALTRWIPPEDRRRLLTPAGDVRVERLEGTQPDTTRPEWDELRARGEAMLAAYANAVRARAVVRAAFADRPFPEDGVSILPGALSLAWPDLGVSFSRNRPVKDLIRRALPVTILLNLIAFPIIYLVAVPAGMLAATRQDAWFDRLSGVALVALWSIPTVWAGVLAIGFLANGAQYLGWFPVSGLHSSGADRMTFLPSRGAGGWEPGYLLDTLWHICLPVACLVYTGFAVLAKQTRAAMLDNFNADYVRTAKAKGVPERDVVLRHVFRNSLLPLITLFASIFPAMLAGSVVIEKIFTVPGMGSLVIEAITLRDRELILANTLMIAGVNLVALLLADILYALADPRIAYD